MRIFSPAFMTAVLIAAGTAQAAMPVYVEFYDGKGNLIDGPVAVKGYEGSLQGISFLHSWLAPLDPITGTPTSGAHQSLLEVSVNPSGLSPQLLEYYAKGARLSKVVFRFPRVAAQGAVTDFYRATIKEVQVVRHKLRLSPEAAASSRGDAEEIFGFAYGDVTLEAGTVIVIEQLHYLPGDPNGDLAFDISDPIKLLGYLFLGDRVSCPLSGDVNSDGSVDISDGIAMLSALFTGGPLPPAPFPACGPVPLGHPIPCEQSACDAAVR